MDKSKLNTLWWVAGLATMVLTVTVMTVADSIAGALGVLTPNVLVIFCGLAGAVGMFAFGYGMIKKVEERNAERD